ncbi:hypothetical protein BCR44DRAFT_1429160 [Catenaria anguillulae PL171]|uniref:Ankyrin repeat-containing domain protein n=1 Tax=Catenaria anguillulae PL171 TaxID=765915 RepID=A0A1Y2HZ04_9FUNG|nr:hypothetical protein BCR44DRAFT_1429160 [Catenaria anguillulae PL171]
MNAAPCITPPNSLPIELAEVVVVLAMRTNTNANSPFRDPAPIVTYLNAFPDSPARDITRAAIMQMWWIDCDWASAHGHVFLLDLLLAMVEHRSLQYSKWALFAAIENCHLDVVEWWYAQARKYQAATKCPLHIESWMSIGMDKLKEHVLRAVQSGNPKAIGVVQWFIDQIWGWDMSGCGVVPERAAQLALFFPPAIQHGLWPILTTLFGDDQQAAVLLAAHYGARMALRCTFNETQGDEFCIGAVSSRSLVFARQVFSQFKILDAHVPIGDCAKAAFRSGHVEMMEWLMDEEGVVADMELLKEAVQAKHIHVVHWYMTRFGIGKEYVGTLLDWGAKYGLIELLELGYTIDPQCLVFSVQAPLLLQVATDQGHVHVLEWWQANNLPVVQGQLGPYDLDAACTHERSVKVLDWWVRKSGLTCYQYSERAVFNATSNNCVAVLEWWKSKSGLPVRVPIQDGFLLEAFSSDASTSQLGTWQKAPRVGATLRWWMQSGLLTKDDYPVEVVVDPNQVFLLDRFRKSGILVGAASVWALAHDACTMHAT